MDAESLKKLLQGGLQGIVRKCQTPIKIWYNNGMYISAQKVCDICWIIFMSKIREFMTNFCMWYFVYVYQISAYGVWKEWM